MQNALHPKPRSLLLHHPHFLRPVGATSLQARRIAYGRKSQTLVAFTSLILEAEIQGSVICAGRKRRRHGSQRSRQLGFRLLPLLVSNLRIVPQPLDLVLAEFGGGDGGGLGFRRGFGGGGGFWGWRRRGKRMLWIWLVLGLCGCYILHKRGEEINAVMAIVGIGLASVAVMKARKIRVRNWVYGFCCFGGFSSLGWKEKHLRKWVAEVRRSVRGDRGRYRRKGK